MPQMIIFLLAWLVVPAAAQAKAYFALKDEMVSKSDVIAVVEITEVVELDPTVTCGKERAMATVLETLKGTANKNIQFQVPCFYPCAITHVTKGTYLVFLSKSEGGHAGNNWQDSYRPIKDGKVEWYKSDESLPLEWQPRDAVIADVKKAMTKSSNTKADAR